MFFQQTVRRSRDRAIRVRRTVCWKNMTFKDLHYCGSSVQGSESIGNATKIGLMEMLTIGKDTDLCTKEFKVDELTRHFSSANAEAAIANSGSSDRHKLKSARPEDKKKSARGTPT